MASLKEISEELSQVEMNVLRIGARISLSLTIPSEVQRQIRHIQLAQEELKEIKQELEKRHSGVNWEVTWQSLVNPTGKTFTEEAAAIMADALLGGDPEERRKSFLREQATLRNQIQFRISQGIPETINQYITKGNQLIALGREYLRNPAKVKARIKAEKQAEAKAKVFSYGVVFLAVGILLVVAIANGQLNSAAALSFAVVTIGLALIALIEIRNTLK